MLREDFRRSPVKAVWKRVNWRLRWLVKSKPLEVRHSAGFSMAVPKGAPGALIYYLGCSEPETAAFITEFLKPGMVFFDIGAHAGEYSLLAASRVGERGQVHAFEPQPSTAALLRKNCAANRLQNVTINSCAVSNREGEVEFDVCSEPSLSSIAAPRSFRKNEARIRVPATTLDAYCRRVGARPDLVKIDVEGAEGLVFQGAAELLRRPDGKAPAILFECLGPTYKRFGFTPEKVIDFVRCFGYRVYRIAERGHLRPHESPLPNSLVYNLMALKA